jgi:hypothetical protein
MPLQYQLALSRAQDALKKARLDYLQAVAEAADPPTAQDHARIAAALTRAFKRFDDCLEVYSAFAARLECGTCQQSLMASDTPTDPME